MEWVVLRVGPVKGLRSIVGERIQLCPGREPLLIVEACAEKAKRTWAAIACAASSCRTSRLRAIQRRRVRSPKVRGIGSHDRIEERNVGTLRVD